MKVNTVCISLDEYESLKKFKQEVESGKVFCIETSHYWERPGRRSTLREDVNKKYYTQNKAIENFSEKNQELIIYN